VTGHQQQFHKRYTIQPYAGNKIPTVINGKVTKVETKKPSSSLKNSTRVPGNKINKYGHKVKIIGDSHLKGSAVRISQYLNKILSYAASSNLVYVLTN